MSPKHFLNFTNLSRKDLINIIDRGLELKTMVSKPKSMEGKILGLLFEKPSTRTRISFEAGMQRLGGSALFLSGQELQMSRGEPISDTAKVMSSMLDAIVIRTDSQENLEMFAANSSVPVISGLSDVYHPCQIMADLMTFKEVNKNLNIEKVCWIGDGNNVCHSYMEAAQILEFQLSIFCPKGHEPNAKILESSKNFVTISSSKEEALSDASIVTTDVWTSMNSAKQSKEKELIFKDFFVDSSAMNFSKEGSMFLHCLPAHRGEEVSFEMLDHPSSKVWMQAENRMHVQEAILEYLLLD
jgi:ornithine carbamoyltransferase